MNEREGGINLPDVDEGDGAEGVVTPLVRGLHERTHETSDDNHPGEEHRSEDVREREASGEKQEGQEQREVDEPLDVADPL